MGWIRDIRGCLGAGTLTMVMFGGGPMLAGLGYLIGGTEIVVTPDRQASFEAGTADDAVILTLAALHPPTEGEATEATEAPHDSETPAGAPTPEPTASEIDPQVRPPAAVAASPPVKRVLSADVEEKAAVVAKKRRKGRRCELEPIDAITPTGDRTWQINRSIIRRYTTNFARLNSLGWSKQHDGEDGRADGMVIGGVRCNNDLHRAGIRSGDVVHTVNGKRVRSIPQALLVYAKVHNDPVVRVEITRRGERKVLVYRLVG